MKMIYKDHVFVTLELSTFANKKKNIKYPSKLYINKKKLSIIFGSFISSTRTIYLSIQLESYITETLTKYHATHNRRVVLTINDTIGN